jgi:SHS2 domain-containing protein
MVKYRYLKDLTSDVMFEAFGKDESELFEHAAEAMFGVVAKINKVGHTQKLEFDFDGEDLRNTIYHFLNNLLAEAEIAEMFLSKFEVEMKKVDGGYKGKVIAWGEPISPEKGETVVKAVTLYKLSAEKIKDGFRAVVVCDI